MQTALTLIHHFGRRPKAGTHGGTLRVRDIACNWFSVVWTHIVTSRAIFGQLGLWEERGLANFGQLRHDIARTIVRIVYAVQLLLFQRCRSRTRPNSCTIAYNLARSNHTMQLACCLHVCSCLPTFTLSFPRVINVKFPLQPHQKFNITKYGELGFSSLTQMKDDYTVLAKFSLPQSYISL